MKKLTTRLHGLLDYTYAVILITPWVMDYYQGSNDTWIFGALGIMTLIYSLLTDYDFGLIKLIPMKVHLVLDFIAGVVLILTPWLFPLYHYHYYWPVILGIVELIVVLMSSSKPYKLIKEETRIGNP